MGTHVWDVMVVGGVATDFSILGTELPLPGEERIGHVYRETVGGRGANQATAAVRFGARTTLLTCIGRDERGESALRHLRESGVDLRHVARTEDPTAATAHMIGSNGIAAAMSSLGANRSLTTADVEAARSSLESARSLLLTLEPPLEVITAAARIARAAGAKVVLDPAPALPLLDELLRLADVVRVSAWDAHVLTGLEVRDRTSARRAADVLMRRGAGAVAVDAGIDGTLLVTSEREIFLPPLRVDTIDRTGSSEAFAAALATGMARDESLGASISFAHAAAALTSTVLGAHNSAIDRHAVERFLQTVDAGSRR